jgi:hypothetical protein
MRTLLLAVLLVTGCSSKDSSDDGAEAQATSKTAVPAKDFLLNTGQVEAAREAAARRDLCDADEPAELCAALRAVVDLGGIFAENARTTCAPAEAKGNLACREANAPAACASLASALEAYANQHGAAALEAFARAQDQQGRLLAFQQRHDRELAATFDLALMLGDRCKLEPRVAKALTKLGAWGHEQ